MFSLLNKIKKFNAVCREISSIKDIHQTNVVAPEDYNKSLINFSIDLHKELLWFMCLKKYLVISSFSTVISFAMQSNDWRSIPVFFGCAFCMCIFVLVMYYGTDKDTNAF